MTRQVGMRAQAAHGRGNFDLSLSDPVHRYVLEAKPLHDSLRRALIQISGFLLKRLTSRRDSLLNYEAVEAARLVLREAAESLGNLRAPAAAAHHLSHLEGASAALERAVKVAMSRADADGSALYVVLEEAEKHVRAASRTLPGFEIVDLGQACCAAHSGALALRCFG